MMIVELLDYVDNYHITTTYPSYTDSLVARTLTIQPKDRERKNIMENIKLLANWLADNLDGTAIETMGEYGGENDYQKVHNFLREHLNEDADFDELKNTIHYDN